MWVSVVSWFVSLPFVGGMSFGLFDFSTHRKFETLCSGLVTAAWHFWIWTSLNLTFHLEHALVARLFLWDGPPENCCFLFGHPLNPHAHTHTHTKVAPTIQTRQYVFVHPSRRGCDFPVISGPCLKRIPGKVSAWRYKEGCGQFPEAYHKTETIGWIYLNWGPLIMSTNHCELAPY